MSPLNENQKLYMWVGIAACVAMGLYPPWKFVNEAPAAFGFLYSPPSPPGLPVKLDLIRLGVEWCIVGFATAGMIVSAAKDSNKQNSGTSKASANSPGTSANSTNAAANSTSTDNGSQASSADVVAASAPKTDSHSSKTDKVGSNKAIKFPDFSVGEVLVESKEDPDYWDGIGEARGTVYVPTKSNVQLEALKEKPMHLVALKDMDSHALQSIDFSESAVTDEDLAYISHFSRLYEIDLSHTSITDDGIEHLSKINSLKKIWLDSTKVTDASLDSLKKLQQLTKVSLTGTDISESSIKSVKEVFPRDCEIIMASGITA